MKSKRRGLSGALARVFRRRRDAPFAFRIGANWLNYTVDALVFCGLLAFALASPQIPLPQKLACLAAGYLVFPLVEYAIHRFLLHHAPLLRRQHLRHHADPDENVITAAYQSLLVALALWLPLYPAIGPVRASAAVAGAYLGYAGFKLVHDWVHFGTFREGHLLYGLHGLHEAHHRDPRRNFGVTTAFWDRVFGTYARAAQPTSSRDESGTSRRHHRTSRAAA